MCLPFTLQRFHQPRSLIRCEPARIVRMIDKSENARSPGVLATAGTFGFLAMGDLVKIKKRDQVHPVNKIIFGTHPLITADEWTSKIDRSCDA